ALQHSTPDDYIFATGQLHTVQDIIEIAFAAIGLDWHRHVKLDPNFLRPAEPLQLVGDAGKARAVLRWMPKIPFSELIQEMTLAELDNLH
ncbi:MAG: GDP-mannose 4,6-dehydratase, partial [Gammaproteobacteria bacterium]|nr:GDP-mannose 4,6-dehydratase [Gammaproteobacteria bacterium]